MEFRHFTGKFFWQKPLPRNSGKEAFADIPSKLENVMAAFLGIFRVKNYFQILATVFEKLIVNFNWPEIFLGDFSGMLIQFKFGLST